MHPNEVSLKNREEAKKEFPNMYNDKSTTDPCQKEREILEQSINTQLENFKLKFNLTDVLIIDRYNPGWTGKDNSYLEIVTVKTGNYGKRINE